MVDWDDDLPPIKTSLTQELAAGAGMVRSVLKLSLMVGASVGAVATLSAIAIERMRRV